MGITYRDEDQHLPLVLPSGKLVKGSPEMAKSKAQKTTRQKNTNEPEINVSAPVKIGRETAVKSPVYENEFAAVPLGPSHSAELDNEGGAGKSPHAFDMFDGASGDKALVGSHELSGEGEGGTFLLRGGEHKEGNKTYEWSRDHDTYVESEHPLDTLFGETKFLRVDKAAAYRKAKAIVQEKEAEEAAKARSTAAKMPAKPKDSGKVDRTTPVAAAPGELGDDVTADFDGAEDAEFKVFKKGKFYSVADVSNPNKALNEDEFSHKDQVNKFIKENAE